MRRDQIRAVVLTGFAAGLMLVIGWLLFRGKIVTVVNLIREDGILESLGALASLAAGATFLYLAFLHKPADVANVTHSRKKWWYVALGVGLLAMFVEEISWGQRAFGFSTPEWLEGENRQQEFNLHNLFLFNPRYDFNWLKLLWVFASIAYLGIVSIVAAVFPSVRNALNTLGLPIACWPIGVVILVSCGWYFNETEQARQWGNHMAGHAVGETFELIIEVLFLALAIQCLDQAVSTRSRWRISMAAVMLPAIVVVGVGYYRSESIPREVQAAAELQQGIALLSQGRVRQALSHFMTSNDILPHNPGTEFHIGLVYHSLNDFDSAVAYFRAALSHDPQMMEARFNLGRTYLDLKEYAMARDVFLSVLATHPEDPDSHYCMALSLKGLGENETAEQHLREALRIRPQFEKARQELHTMATPQN